MPHDSGEGDGTAKAANAFGGAPAQEFDKKADQETSAADKKNRRCRYYLCPGDGTWISGRLFGGSFKRIKKDWRIGKKNL
jgi:hypothetical protein